MSLLETLDERPRAVPEELRAAAATEADAAARRAGVTVGILDDIDELRLAAQLFSRVWEFADGDEPKVPLDLLRALSHAGSYVAGAWAGSDLVGASLGFARLQELHPSLHSHITGVMPGSAGSGVGWAMKLHQRSWAVDRGIREILWTFDPLVRRNAYFNVSKLGACIIGYYDNFYGPMPDGLNNRDESDRCLARWDLVGDRARDAIAGNPPQPERVGESIVLLDEHRAGAPLAEVPPGGRARVWVPEDIVSIRRADRALGSAWRLAVRGSLGAAIRAGWTVSQVRADGWFELEEPG